MKKLKRYQQLFSATFYISAFTFGGGYVIIPMLKEKFVDEYGWLTEEDMLNFAAIAQSSPGAIAVNAAILVGYKVAGVLGAVIAMIGTILPPFIILTVISYFYDAFRSNEIVSTILKAMQASIAAIICHVAFHMGALIVKHHDWILNLIMISAFLAIVIFEINVLWIILLAGLIGMINTYINIKGEVFNG